MKRVAYLGWMGAGNLGDEGCFQLFRRAVHLISTQITCVPLTIREAGGKLYSVAPVGRTGARSRWNPGAYDYVVLGGGSLLHAERYVEALLAAQRAGVPTAIWGTGFDGLPHRLAAACTRAEAPGGTRAGPAPHPAVAEVVRGCRVAGVRGPVTVSWLKAHGCRAVPVSGDPGLLFEPPSADPADSPAPGPNRPRDRVTVIWGTSHRATHEGPQDEELAAIVAGRLRPLARRGRLVVCTMWARDLPAAERLASRIGEDVELRREPLTLRSFGELMNQTAWTLSYRLHGCIFSAACGVPFASIAYRSKCYDFAFSVEAGGWVIDPGDTGFGEKLDAWVEGVLDEEGPPGRLGVSPPDEMRKRVLLHRRSLAEIVKTITRELDDDDRC